MKQTPGKIYLADQRGHVATEQLQRFSTFNFGDYYQEHKIPFGNLYVVNEETLAGARRLMLQVDKPSYILIIPVTGAVCLSTEPGTEVMVEAGELQVITAPANSSIEVTNPFPQDTIQLLQLRILAPGTVTAVSFQAFYFNLDEPNKPLTPIRTTDQVKENLAYPFFLSIGRFAGRQEVSYTLKDKNQLFFAFVIAGAFEAEGRLLHEKDGLALWDTKEVELEALSNNALILVLELEPSLLN